MAPKTTHCLCHSYFRYFRYIYTNLFSSNRVSFLCILARKRHVDDISLDDLRTIGWHNSSLTIQVLIVGFVARVRQNAVFVRECGLTLAELVLRHLGYLM